MKRSKPIDPTKRYIVMEGDTPVTPPFYHQDLAKAAQREIAKDRPRATLSELPASESTAGFQEAIHAFSKESRWLELRKPEFATLCEGWASMARPVGDPSGGLRGPVLQSDSTQQLESQLQE